MVRSGACAYGAGEVSVFWIIGVDGPRLHYLGPVDKVTIVGNYLQGVVTYRGIQAPRVELHYDHDGDLWFSGEQEYAHIRIEVAE